MAYLFLALMGVLACVYALIRRSAGLSIRFLVKGTASVMFVLAALCTYVMHPDIYCLLVLLGLIASLAGDLLLLFTHRTKKYLLGGMLSFFVAHLLYISAFCTITAPSWMDAVFLAGLLIVGVLLMRIRRVRLGRYFPAVFVYTAVLCFMAARAVSMLWAGGMTVAFAVCAAAGGLLFVTSDALLGGEQFADAKKLVGGLSTITYYGAQALIALTAAVLQ